MNYKKISKRIRYQFLELIEKGLKYHIGGTASCIDILVVIFYSKIISLKKINRDNFILSKGHALGALHAILIDQKLISQNNLIKLHKSGKIGSQIDIFNLKKFMDWNTGSLGHSIGVSIGFAISNPQKKIWTMIGDAEIDEGSVWEGLFFISEKKINNIIIIIDRNKISATAKIDKKEVLDKKFLNQLNLNIFRINGHDHSDIYKCLIKSKKSKKSSIIIANTVKGKGFGVVENNLDYSVNLPNKNILKKIKNSYEK
ncbi:1-deoxy-D-xylulose-5-phosphate synthase N-terminal domain-containing protein [Candidatus Pelagibacter sp.]|nr:1-deoxy-D-xylulose-5-phosphate synthase N-terminal domain-containing protein [Candidatus Pelagibacter sp.]